MPPKNSNKKRKAESVPKKQIKDDSNHTEITIEEDPEDNCGCDQKREFIILCDDHYEKANINYDLKNIYTYWGISSRIIEVICQFVTLLNKLGILQMERVKRIFTVLEFQQLALTLLDLQTHMFNAL